MPDPENKKSRRPLKTLPPDRFQPKMWFFWLALVGAVAVLLALSPMTTSSPDQLTIGEVVERAEAGNINPSKEAGKAAVIRSDTNGGPTWMTVTGESRADANSPFKPLRSAARVTDAPYERLMKTKLFKAQP